MSPLSRVLVVVSCIAAAVAGCTKPSGAPDGGAPAASSASAAPIVPMVKWDPGVRDTAIAEGRTVIEKHQCTRCHAVDDVPTAARPLNCASCHVFLTGLKKTDHARQQLVDKYGEEIVARYQRNIQHLIQLPALTGIARRVRPTFLASFLRSPLDLRPALEESMIRHKLSEDEIRKVVRYLAARAEADDPFAPGYAAPPDPLRAPAERIEEGKRLFLGRGCVACHTYGNLATGVTAATLEKAGVAAQLAPNLRFARERLRPEAIVAWIVNPQSLSPGTLMPTLGLSIPEAEAVRDFLLFGDAQLAPTPAPQPPMRPKLLDRPVSYTEMKEKVLGRICVHCHMNDYEKDPGPGNRGGLGYAGVRLQMRTYESLVSGAVDEKGARYSVLVSRTKDSPPPIVESMLRRRQEEPRDRVAAFRDHERPAYPDGVVGMPLGLPSMSDEEISILATWIDQGCKGPTEVTGKAGTDDGYLVPDGPIAKNQGCELRTPETKRPTWAVDPRPAASAGK